MNGTPWVGGGLQAAIFLKAGSFGMLPLRLFRRTMDLQSALVDPGCLSRAEGRQYLHILAQNTPGATWGRDLKIQGNRMHWLWKKSGEKGWSYGSDK